MKTSIPPCKRCLSPIPGLIFRTAKGPSKNLLGVISKIARITVHNFHVEIRSNRKGENESPNFCLIFCVITIRLIRPYASKNWKRPAHPTRGCLCCQCHIIAPLRGWLPDEVLGYKWWLGACLLRIRGQLCPILNSSVRHSPSLVETSVSK